MRLVIAFLLALPLIAKAGEEPPLSDAIFKGRTDYIIRSELTREARRPLKEEPVPPNLGPNVKFLRGGSGNTEYEAALGRGLFSLARWQLPNGSWEGDGKAQADRVSATSLALLAYLGIGEGISANSKYSRMVSRGIKFLISQQKADGSFEKAANIDGHAWATIMLCEASALTKIEGVRPAAEKALDWLVKNQQKDGSWGVAKGKLGPVVFLAWPVQAVWVAENAGFMISSKEVFRGSTNYLNAHTWDEGRTYGPAKNEPSADLTSAAPMVRYLTGTPLREPALRKAAETMALNPVSDKNPVLHQRHYFESQFLHLQDGPDWKTWGNAMRIRLITTQFKEDLEQNNVGSLFRGSWTTDAGDIGEQYGRLGCTAMSLLSLEVYFRYLPPLKRTKGGLTGLER